jgi:hypothetical protein
VLPIRIRFAAPSSWSPAPTRQHCLRRIGWFPRLRPREFSHNRLPQKPAQIITRLFRFATALSECSPFAFSQPATTASEPDTPTGQNDGYPPALPILGRKTGGGYGAIATRDGSSRMGLRPRESQDRRPALQLKLDPFRDAERIIDLVHPAGTEDYRPCPRSLPSSSLSCARIIASRRSSILTI